MSEGEAESLVLGMVEVEAYMRPDVLVGAETTLLFAWELGEHYGMGPPSLVSRCYSALGNAAVPHRAALEFRRDPRTGPIGLPSLESQCFGSVCPHITPA